MSRTTKFELGQLLTARNEELAAARMRISVLEGELALVKRPAPAKPAYIPREPSPEVMARRAAMALARDEAVRTGRATLAAF